MVDQRGGVSRAIKNALQMVSELALGGTAVGTGLNAPKVSLTHSALYILMRPICVQGYYVLYRGIMPSAALYILMRPLCVQGYHALVAYTLDPRIILNLVLVAYTLDPRP